MGLNARLDIVEHASVAGPAAYDVNVVTPLREDAAFHEACAAHPGHAYAHTKKALQRGVPSVSEAQLSAFERDSLPVWVGESLKSTIRKLLKI